LAIIKYRGWVTTRINKNNTSRHKNVQSLGEETWGDGNIEEQWQEVKNSWWKTSEDVLDFETRIYKREWFDADCETAVGKRMKHMNRG
jgi:hypothetical protein